LGPAGEEPGAFVLEERRRKEKCGQTGEIAETCGRNRDLESLAPGWALGSRVLLSLHAGLHVYIA